MIKIVQGTFGYWNGTSVVPKTSKDGPLDLEPELEQRLVKKGVAVFVSAAPADPPATPPTPENDGGTPPDPAAAGQDNDDDGLPAYDAGMKLEELKEIAAIYGVNASKMRSKAAVVAAIDAVKAALDQDPDDGESPPAVGAEPPVV